MSLLAFDVGGANIKVADGVGFARSYPFPLWRYPDRLARRLEDVLAQAPPSDRIVATMTGELADCYRTKREGVASIVDALLQCAGERRVGVYLTDGSIVDPAMAKKNHRLAAASNWHALASFATRFANGEHALLIDIGSTTCDLIPILDDNVAATGQTDTERLLANELVYTGVERTPVCSVVHEVPYRDHLCPLARELFATMLDVHLLLGDIPESSERNDTADGRPATRDAAVARLARCLCADASEFDNHDAIQVAKHIASAQRELLRAAIGAVLERRGPRGRMRWVVSGHGDFLLPHILPATASDEAICRLYDHIGPDATRCAPAHALAVIARQRYC